MQQQVNLVTVYLLQYMERIANYYHTYMYVCNFHIIIVYLYT